MSAGASYRAQQETAAESAELNDDGSAEPRSDSGAGERTPRDSGGSGRGTGTRRIPGAPRGKGKGQGGAAPPSGNYQNIIIAEFIAAELLVSMTPIATRKGQPGLSPYVPRDMTKMLAIGVTYFLLNLTAVTGRSAGRFGAWFGLLVLVAVGLNEAANVTKVLDLFAGTKDTTTTTSDTSGSGDQQQLA